MDDDWESEVRVHRSLLAVVCSLLAAVMSVLVLGVPCWGEDKMKVDGLGMPPAGKLYHGVFPGGFSGAEDDITRDQVLAYEQAAGQPVAWVYFSHNWYQGTGFPLGTCEWIREMGAVPYIRLMLREESRRARNPFSLEAVLDGELDADLRAWGMAARDFSTPLIAEFGTEMNGEWFPWNGKHHGAGGTDGFGDPGKPDGPERFAAAYRHIVEIVRGQGAHNITWVFHVNAGDWPREEWNRFENYYPGDGFVDWLAASAYGPQRPTAREASSFREQMDPCHERLQQLAPHKPIIIAEFGCTAGSPAVAPDVWAGAALEDILGGRWPGVIGFSWWNERWSSDDNPAHDTDMKVENTAALAAVFKAKLGAAADRLIGRPVPGAS